jgi:serine/threonine-protein kinase SRPK3
VPELFDSFELRGPNGVHQCLVMNLSGQSMVSLAESYAANRLPGDVAWKVCKQVVRAIAYLHRTGVVHGGSFCSDVFVTQHAESVFRRSTPG